MLQCAVNQFFERSREAPANQPAQIREVTEGHIKSIQKDSEKLRSVIFVRKNLKKSSVFFFLSYEPDILLMPITPTQDTSFLWFGLQAFSRTGPPGRINCLAPTGN